LATKLGCKIALLKDPLSLENVLEYSELLKLLLTQPPNVRSNF
jgi:hypothetical protein